MTAALLGFSLHRGLFAFTMVPRNTWVATTHFVNVAAQANQAYRYLDYHYFGGKGKGEVSNVSFEQGDGGERELVMPMTMVKTSG
jgi:hypothetical protein